MQPTPPKTLSKAEYAPFHEQLMERLQAYNDEHRNNQISMAELASTLAIPNVDVTKLENIAKGTDFPTMRVAEALATALNIRDKAENFSGQQTSKLRKNFMDAAYDAMTSQPLSTILRSYASEQNITSVRALAANVHLSETNLRVINKKDTFSSRRAANLCAGALELKDEYKERFVKQFGGFHLQHSAVFNELKRGDITLNKAIKSFLQIRGLQGKEFYEALGIPNTQYLSWGNEEKLVIPPPRIVRKLASPEGFDFDREDAEQFCEAANCFLDKEHITRKLKDGAIDIGTAVKAIILLEYDSQRDFAKAKNINNGTVVRWARGDIPRQPLLDLLAGMPDDDKRVYLEKRGFFLNAAHLADAFITSGDRDEFIRAARETYGVKTTDMGVRRETIQRNKSGDTRPTAKTMVREFMAIAGSTPPEDNFAQCWQAFRAACTRSSRYTGNHASSQTDALLLRSLDREYESQKIQR